jgi:hypothetical protein
MKQPPRQGTLFHFIYYNEIGRGLNLFCFFMELVTRLIVGLKKGWNQYTATQNKAQVMN